MTGAVLRVAFRSEHLMLATGGLHPLQIDQLRYKELRKRLLNSIISINGKHPKRSRRGVASRFHLQRQVMEKINSLYSRVQERADVVGQPDSGENVLIGFAGARRKISLGDKHR